MVIPQEDITIMLEPLKKRNDLAGPKVVEALKKRHFEAYMFQIQRMLLQKYWN